MDKTGRVAIPRDIRDGLGLVPGEVEIYVLGTRVVIEQSGTELREIDEHLLLPLGGQPLSPSQIRQMRFADQR